MLAQRFRNHRKNRKKALAAQRKLKTIAGRLLRELERKLPAASLLRYAHDLEIYQRILNQKKNSKNKIYSIHEPQVYCISKGKDHKKYEFGSKSSIVLTKNSGIIVGAVSFSKNVYDGHTLPEVLKQSEELVGRRAKVAICDRGYRGKRMVDGTSIELPGNPETEPVPMKSSRPERSTEGGPVSNPLSVISNQISGSRATTSNEA